MICLLAYALFKAGFELASGLPGEAKGHNLIGTHLLMFYKEGDSLYEGFRFPAAGPGQDQGTAGRCFYGRFLLGV
jgi:hypothetical protein